MKKLFTLLSVLIITFVSFTSCEKPTKEEPNPLVGTKWFASYSDYLMVLEFTSDTQVTGYFAKPNGVYYSGQTAGTYKVSGKTRVIGRHGPRPSPSSRLGLTHERPQIALEPFLCYRCELSYRVSM